MSDAFRFETFVDAHSNIFNEYLGSVIAKLARENEEYRAVSVGRQIEGDANSELFFRHLSY